MPGPKSTPLAMGGQGVCARQVVLGRQSIREPETTLTSHVLFIERKSSVSLSSASGAGGRSRRLNGDPRRARRWRNGDRHVPVDLLLLARGMLPAVSSTGWHFDNPGVTTAMSPRLLLLLLPLTLVSTPACAGDVLTGKDALGDWTSDAPGVRRKITVDDLATPYDTPSADNHPRVVAST